MYILKREIYRLHEERRSSIDCNPTKEELITLNDSGDSRRKKRRLHDVQDHDIDSGIVGPPSAASSERSRKKCPSGWAACSDHGLAVEGIFIPLKVPLDPLKFAVSAVKPFSATDFLSSMTKSGHTIGLVIDLTDTAKYYDGEKEFVSKGIAYRKVRCKGRLPPSDALVQSFIEIVDEFVKTDKENRLVAVHCTHGHNRTGFMIACFLILKMNYSVADAVAKFKSSREPYGLYREDMVDELYSKYGAGAKRDAHAQLLQPPWFTE